MRRVLVPILLATLGFASAANGAAVPAAPVAAIDMFTIADMKVEATAPSPRAARDLAMLQGRPLAWTKLFRQVTVQAAWASEPQLTDGQIQGLILSVDLGNERRNTTRYLADVMYHFNPAAVRALLRKSNIAFTATNEPSVDRRPPTTHLLANVRFNNVADWTSLIAQLSVVDGVTEIVVSGLAHNEAQIDLSYIGELDQLQDALAQKNLVFGDRGGEYTLKLNAVTASNSAQ
jgi:hypothetical protein